MKRGGRNSRKAGVISLADHKPPVYFQSRNHSLSQIPSYEGSSSDLQSALTVNRTASIEDFTEAKLKRSDSRQVTKAISPNKVKLKGENTSKQGFIGIPRSISHSDITIPLLAARRHKRNGLSLQFDTESLALSSKPSTTAKSGKGAKYVFTSMHGKWAQLPGRSSTPDPVGSAEQNWNSQKDALLTAIETVSRDDLKAHMKLYHSHFSKVIQSSGSLSSILTVIQTGYEGLFQDLQEKFTSEVNRLQSEVIHLQANILHEAEDRKTLLNKLERLARENVEISESCQKYEEKLKDYQEKLFDIANVRMEEYPPTQQAWKVLNSELEYYQGWKAKADRDLKISQAKEKKLIRLMHALKSRGYPVEETYLSEFKPSAHSAESTQPRDENESQRLVSGRPKSLPKPANVPGLNLELAQSEASFEAASEEVHEDDLSLGSFPSTRFRTDDLSPIPQASTHHK